MNYFHDLNAVSNYISKLYALIGRRVNAKLNLQSPWLDLFTSNSLRIRNALNQEISTLGISRRHWITLQEIRKHRNRIMHPQRSLDQIHQISNRWRNRRQAIAIRQLIQVFHRIINSALQFCEDESSASHACLQTNWRDRQIRSHSMGMDSETLKTCPQPEGLVSEVSQNSGNERPTLGGCPVEYPDEENVAEYHHSMPLPKPQNCAQVPELCAWCRVALSKQSTTSSMKLLKVFSFLDSNALHPDPNVEMSDLKNSKLLSLGNFASLGMLAPPFQWQP